LDDHQQKVKPFLVAHVARASLGEVISLDMNESTVVFGLMSVNIRAVESNLFNALP
jgi:hypothetical protein